MNRLNLFYLFLFSLGLIACGEEELPPPENLMPREQFVEVMVEVQLIEAVFNQNMIRSDEPRMRIARYYKETFERLGVDREDFEATHTWYHRNPDLLQEVYDEVISILSQRQSALERRSPGADQ